MPVLIIIGRLKGVVATVGPLLARGLACGWIGKLETNVNSEERCRLGGLRRSIGVCSLAKMWQRLSGWPSAAVVVGTVGLLDRYSVGVLLRWRGVMAFRVMHGSMQVDAMWWYITTRVDLENKV